MIGSLLSSIAHQRRLPDQMIVVDNASADATVSMVRAAKLPIQLITESMNTGFAAGHNTALSHATSDIAIICNPDIILDPSTIFSIERAWNELPESGAIIGELRRSDSMIDSLGVRRDRGFRFYNIDEGTPRKHAHTRHAVFGVPGAFFSIRTSTAKALSWEGELFDVMFFAYKEDVDLSFRIHEAGLEILFDPAITATHTRTVKRFGGPAAFASLRSHAHQSSRVRFLSYRNHLWTVLKHVTAKDLVQEFPWILWYELQKAGFLLVTSPWTLVRAWIQTIQQLPRIVRFRHRSSI